ncbi:MAG: hypothetical protein K6C94_03565 [Candidatus Gastranaerophilales bacterium]|nr:hypothetical protein [Candidatus Gastranaerophilales bacterium]
MGLNVGMNPMDMLRKYKVPNMDEAMSGINGQMNPQAMQLQSNSIFNMAGNQQNLMTDPMSMTKGNMPVPPMPQQDNQGGFMQNIMNFFKGAPNEEDTAKMPSPLLVNGVDPTKEDMIKPDEKGAEKADAAQMKGGQAPKDAGMMDPETYAEKYAQAQGISVDEARAQLKAKFGDPKKQ